MRPFDELSKTGQLRRLRSVAQEIAATRYGLVGARVRLLSSHSFNTMVRVDCEGQRYVLRARGR